jgi:hypothetical protein
VSLAVLLQHTAGSFTSAIVDHVPTEDGIYIDREEGETFCLFFNRQEGGDE